MRRSKKIPPPVLEDKKKKAAKKSKRSPKNSFSKENKVSTVLKEKTKIYTSINTCEMLNMDDKGVYDRLYKLKLCLNDLVCNRYPLKDVPPPNLVPEGNNRLCARCGVQFEIYNGLHLSDKKCLYHPTKPFFDHETQMKTYPCCKKTFGEPGCTTFNYHVTVQHGPKTFSQTVYRRHVKRDLQHRIYSLDCEMSYTTGGLEVTKIGVVNFNGQTILETYVKPTNAILDYNTLYSGVTKQHLQNVKVTLDDVRKTLLSFIFEDTILIGHALNNDLVALGIIHKTVIDTSVLYPNTKFPRYKLSLKSLAKTYLKKTIQDSPSGHDCIEDARVALQLALLKVPSVPQEPVSSEKKFEPLGLKLNPNAPRFSCKEEPVSSEENFRSPQGKINANAPKFGSREEEHYVKNLFNPYSQIFSDIQIPTEPPVYFSQTFPLPFQDFTRPPLLRCQKYFPEVPSAYPISLNV